MSGTSAADKEEESLITYSFTVSVKGVSEADGEAFSSNLTGWVIKPGKDGLFLYPRNRENGVGTVSDYLRSVLLNDRGVLERVAAIANDRRTLSVAIYYDAEKIMMMGPTIDADVIRQLADLNFALDLCMFPCSTEDEEE